MSQSQILEVKIPFENVNDTLMVITEWLVGEGEYVEVAAPLANVEGAKSNIEVLANGAGYFYPLYAKGEKIAVDAVIGFISMVQDGVLLNKMIQSKKTSKEGELSPLETFKGGRRVSRAAQRKIDEFCLDPGEFSEKLFVTEQDVLTHLVVSQKSVPYIQAAPKKNRLIIVGAGGHAKTCIELLRQIGGYEVVGLVASEKEVGLSVLGVEVIGVEKELSYFYEHERVHNLVVGVGATQNPKIREAIFQRYFKMGFCFPNLIHPSAVVESSASLGVGNQIMAGAYVGSCVSVKNNCIINTHAVVSHDCVLSDNVHIAPGAVLAGHVQVGKNTLIGMNASIYIHVEVGENTTIGNGVSIFKNIPDHSIIK